MERKNLTGITLAGQYFLRNLAGSGGMADVYQGWDRERRIEMAIKVLHEEKARDLRFIELFIKEAMRLRELEHPNIIRLYEAIYDKAYNVLFLVMDWIEGRDLQSALDGKKGRPFDVAEVNRILGFVFNGLHYAHNKKIYHCDIKPSNILIRSSDQHALLSDFGVARLADEQGGGGTLHYMAPERFITGEISQSTDIYALGITIFQLLSGGKLPFQGHTREEIVKHIIKYPVPYLKELNPDLSKDIITIVDRSLSKNSKQRQQSVSELWTTFDQAARRAMFGKPHLFHVKGGGSQMAVSLSKNRLIVGRRKDSGLRLNNLSVSRVHAVISWEQESFFISDKNSSLGTYINGRRIPVNKKVKLRDRDKIKIGVADVFEFREK